MDIAIRWFNKFQTMIWWWWRWCLFLMDWASEKQKKMVPVRNQVEDCELLSFFTSYRGKDVGTLCESNFCCLPVAAIILDQCEGEKWGIGNQIERIQSTMWQRCQANVKSLCFDIISSAHLFFSANIPF
jgi:hypothetical protein